MMQRFCLFEGKYPTRFLMFYLFYEERESDSFFHRLFSSEPRYLKEMRRLEAKNQNNCSLLPRLRPVPRTDFEAWMDEYDVFPKFDLGVEYLDTVLEELGEKAEKRGVVRDGDKISFSMRFIERQIYELEQQWRREAL